MNSNGCHTAKFGLLYFETGQADYKSLKAQQQQYLRKGEYKQEN